MSNFLTPSEVTSEIFSLAGRHVVVTGAGRGIGRQLALGFASFGASVACLGRDLGRLEETAGMIEDLGGSAMAHAADLNDQDAAPAAIAAVAEQLGGINVLVNNAGIDHASSVEETSLETWNRVLDVNNRAVFQLSQAASPYLRASGGWGKIINVGSILGSVGCKSAVAYTTSKHGLIGMTRAFALEWADSGVQVNALCPGWVRTDMTSDLHEFEEGSDWVVSQTPMMRWGETTDMVGAAVFLASRASNFVTGQALIIDGGYTAQ